MCVRDAIKKTYHNHCGKSNIKQEWKTYVKALCKAASFIIFIYFFNVLQKLKKCHKAFLIKLFYSIILYYLLQNIDTSRNTNNIYICLGVWRWKLFWGKVGLSGTILVLAGIVCFGGKSVFGEKIGFSEKSYF